MVEPGVCQRGGGEEYGDTGGHTNTDTERASDATTSTIGPRFRVVLFGRSYRSSTVKISYGAFLTAKTRRMSGGWGAGAAVADRAAALLRLLQAGSGVLQNVAGGNDVGCSGTVSQCVVWRRTGTLTQDYIIINTNALNKRQVFL